MTSSFISDCSMPLVVHSDIWLQKWLDSLVGKRWMLFQWLDPLFYFIIIRVHNDVCLKLKTLCKLKYYGNKKCGCCICCILSFETWSAGEQSEKNPLEFWGDWFWYAVSLCRGIRCSSCWKHCTTSWKVTGSIPDSVIGIFYWHNPSGRTMALGLTHPITEMSTRNISWGVKAAGA